MTTTFIVACAIAFVFGVIVAALVGCIATSLERAEEQKRQQAIEEQKAKMKFFASAVAEELYNKIYYEVNKGDMKNGRTNKN